MIVHVAQAKILRLCPLLVKSHPFLHNRGCCDYACEFLGGERNSKSIKADLAATYLHFGLYSG